MKLRKISITNYKIFKDFELDLTNNGITQNLIVIAGINGSGKTTLLRDIIFEFFANHRINGDVNITFESFNNNANKIEILSFDRTSLQDNEINKHGYIDLKFPKTYYFKAGEINQKKSKDIILEFIDKLIYQKDKKSSEAYEVVQKILQDLFSDFDMQVKFSGIGQDRDVYFQNNDQNQIKIEELSSGEQELITKCFSLYLAEIKNSIILVDEPEGSMHPNWQNRIINIYQKIANENNNQIFLATHSPHIVSSVNKEQIRVFIKEDNKIRAIHDFSGSYGWRIDKILLEIFRITTLRTPVIQKEISILKQQILNNDFDNNEFTNKLSYLEKILGFDDIDLTMLRFEKKIREKQNEKD